jgi:hypothetical protein
MSNTLKRPPIRIRLLLRMGPAVFATLLFLQGVAGFAGGPAPAKKLVNIADTRNLGPGLSRWIADIYNTSYWSYGVSVVLIMALMGLVLGFFCDRMVSLLGLNLGKMQHHE